MFILKWCFLQLTRTDLDGCQKEGGNFLNLLQKEGLPRTGGLPQKRGGSNPGGNYGGIFISPNICLLLALFSMRIRPINKDTTDFPNLSLN